MKNFVKHTLAIAICAAALLSSCIKEPEYIRSTAELSVSLTGIEDTRSETQGNLIQDAWIWAYQCTLSENGAPQIEDTATPVASRYVTGLNATNQISVHVPMPMCSEVNGTVVPQSYLLVAVINTKAFGSLDINANSNWGTVKNATFAQTGDFWDSYPKDNAPQVMPISNWTTLTITNADTHSDLCYALNLPVYRAVAKTQLYMSKAGEFDLKVLDAKVVANREYSNGMLLTGNANRYQFDADGNPTTTQLKGANDEAIQQGLPSEDAATWWWNASPTAKTADKGYQLKNGTSGFAETTITAKGNATNPQNGSFDWVASTFLLENDTVAGTLTERNAGHDSRVGDGYNLCVQYKVDDGDVKTVYTPLGKVVRNHDYQVKATVDAGGELTFDIEVVDWIEEKINMTYENTVTIDPNGYLKWTQLPNTTITSDTGITYTEQVINMTESAGQMAVCTFALQTPQYGTWHAELLTIEGVSGAIAFFDQDGKNLGTSTSGPISWLEGDEIPTGKVVGDPRPGKLIIKTVKGNYTGEGSLGRNLVELRIYATGPAGVYQIPNLPGEFIFNTDGTIKFSYYQLLQPRM